MTNRKVRRAGGKAPSRHRLTAGSHHAGGGRCGGLGVALGRVLAGWGNESWSWLSQTVDVLQGSFCLKEMGRDFNPSAGVSGQCWFFGPSMRSV
ncbi:hypothetical protein I7I48_01397 [Histoplasma ohiense]|nr:hypothetical protein I7I48_01397 [Histoplasma ohiense (nom. inval.)]